MNNNWSYLQDMLNTPVLIKTDVTEKPATVSTVLKKVNKDKVLDNRENDTDDVDLWNRVECGISPLSLSSRIRFGETATEGKMLIKIS